MQKNFHLYLLWLKKQIIIPKPWHLTKVLSLLVKSDYEHSLSFPSLQDVTAFFSQPARSYCFLFPAH